MSGRPPEPCSPGTSEFRPSDGNPCSRTIREGRDSRASRPSFSLSEDEPGTRDGNEPDYPADGRVKDPGIKPENAGWSWALEGGDHAHGVRAPVRNIDVPVAAIISHATRIVPDRDCTDDRYSRDHTDVVRIGVRHVDVPVPAVVPDSKGNGLNRNCCHHGRPGNHGDVVRASVRHVDVPVPAVIRYAPRTVPNRNCRDDGRASNYT